MSLRPGDMSVTVIPAPQGKTWVCRAGECFAIEAPKPSPSTPIVIPRPPVIAEALVITRDPDSSEIIGVIDARQIDEAETGPVEEIDVTLIGPETTVRGLLNAAKFSELVGAGEVAADGDVSVDILGSVVDLDAWDALIRAAQSKGVRVLFRVKGD